MRRLLNLLQPALVLAGLAACGTGAPAGPSAVLITLDTTRWDALGALGQLPELADATPTLDGLAAESLLFTNAHTVTPLTLPSHSSMLTGLVPPRHTVRDNNAKLPASAETIAERARAGGYATAAFIASAALDAQCGTDQGFEIYDQPTSPELQTQHEYEERSARAVTDAALGWLAGRDRERPFLLWVHYFDPHAPYAPPAEFAQRASGHPYYAEVAGMDHELGRLLTALRADPAWADTLVTVVADHGESLGEHGEYSHSAFCYEGVLRVPLLVRLPGGARAGERSAAIVSVADVFPTLLEHLALGAPGDVDGRSLLAAPDPDRGIYFESYYGYLYYGWSPLAGWLDARGKYLESSRPELYDLASDPGEETSLEERFSTEQARYRAALAAVIDAPRLAPDAEGEVDQEHLLRLQKIGYAAGGDTADLPSPLEPSSRPAPHRRRRELQMFVEAQTLTGRGELERAVPLLEHIVRQNPLHMYAQYELGQSYKRLRMLDQAVEPLRRTIALGNDWYGPHFSLGVVLARLGQTDEAVVHLERTLEFKPDFLLAYDELIALYERAGRAQDAEQVHARRTAAAAER